MASTVTQVGRKRRADLRQILSASKKLDAAQETLEREIRRMISRKRMLPELSDYQRLYTMLQATDDALGSMVSVVASLGATWAVL